MEELGIGNGEVMERAIFTCYSYCRAVTIVTLELKGKVLRNLDE